MASPAKQYPNEALQAPMRRLCSRLKESGIDLNEMRALEFFAREGDWQTVSYLGEVRELDAWEINPLCEEALMRNLPGANIRIGDSFQLARLPEFANIFDLIVFDNPQVTFGEKDQYCEHFEALPLVPLLLKAKGMVILNVNTSPYDYEEHSEWQKRRQAFYGIKKTNILELNFLKKFYTLFFNRMDYAVTSVYFEPRHDDMIYYCAVRLVRKKEPR